MHARRQRRSVPLAIVAVVVLAAACGDASPSVRPTPTGRDPVSVPTMVVPTESPEAALTFEPEPSDTDTGSPGTPPCDVAALKASHGITELDADDRTTEVVLVAADTCSVDAFPSLRLEDGDGTILVSAEPGGPGGIDLVGGVAYTSQVRLSNWCLGEPSYPVRIGILQGFQTLVVTGESFPDESDLPPCVHDDAAPLLTGTAWSPSP